MSKAAWLKAWIKPLVVLIVLALLLSYAVPYALTGQFGTSWARISLSFDGIGEGLDPKGNPFDINDIKSDVVLKGAIEKAGLTDSLSASRLRSLIAIVPQVSSGALAQLTTLGSTSTKTLSVSEKVVHPSQFTIQLKDKGMPSLFSDKALLNAILSSYNEYLKAKYLMDAQEEQYYTKEEILALDYPEMVDILDQQAAALTRFVNGFVRNAPKFVGKESGLSFSDLYEQSVAIEEMDISGLSGIVDHLMLTRDAQRRTNYEESLLKRANLSLQKAAGRQTNLETILNMYNNTENYAFIWQNTSEMEERGGDDPYYNSLINQTVSSKSATINARYNRDEIQKDIDKLANSTLTEAAYQERRAQVEKEAAGIYDKMEALRTQVRVLADENYEENIAAKTSMTMASYDLNSSGHPVLWFILLGAVYLLWLWLRRSGQLSRARALLSRNPLLSKMGGKDGNPGDQVL